jgi:hypothetical protein
MMYVLLTLVFVPIGKNRMLYKSYLTYIGETFSKDTCSKQIVRLFVQRTFF